MKRALLIGAGILIVAAAIPLWMAVADGDGDRRTGALVTVLPPAPLDCGTKELFAGCRALSNSIDAVRLQFNEFDEARGTLADEIADLRAKGASADAIRMEILQARMQAIAQALERLSNISKAQHDAAQTIINNLKG